MGGPGRSPPTCKRSASRQKAAVDGGRRRRPQADGTSAGQRALPNSQHAGLAVESDRRIVGRVGWRGAFGLGASQILALLPGISRDGMVMVAGMFRGLSRQDAARFSFLLSAPVILAAGVLKIPDLTGPLGAGIRGEVLFGSALSFCRRLPLAAIPDAVLRQPEAHTDTVRDLLHGRGPGLLDLPVREMSGERPSARGAVVNAAGLVQGIALVTFPAASTIFTSPGSYDLSRGQYGVMFIPQVSTAIVASLLSAGLLWPALTRRASEKTLLLAGLLADLASMALLIASWLVVHQRAAAFALLLGATACLGAGFGLSVPSLNTLAAALHPAAVDRSVLVLNALLGLGTALAPVFVAAFNGLGFWIGLPVLAAGLLAGLIGVSLRLPLDPSAGSLRRGSAPPGRPRAAGSPRGSGCSRRSPCCTGSSRR